MDDYGNKEYSIFRRLPRLGIPSLQRCQIHHWKSCKSTFLYLLRVCKPAISRWKSIILYFLHFQMDLAFIDVNYIFNSGFVRTIVMRMWKGYTKLNDVWTGNLEQTNISHTMLQKLSKCEVKNSWCGYFSNLLLLRFYVKSNFDVIKRSKNAIFANFRSPELWFE